MLSISNKHEEFFNYLISNAENFHRGAEIANEVMRDVSTISIHIKEVVALEHTANKTNQNVIIKLCRVFITPIDREDFYRLTCILENCIDSLHGALMRTSVYHVEKAPAVAIQITEQLKAMGEELKQIFVLLKDISSNEAELMERANRLSKLETEVDHMYRRELSRIFSGNVPILDVIRWKDILSTLEETADHVERLGNVIKEVTMKYA
ncbi:phosphate transport regulator [Megasphaera cerevisiae DSM 20462]|uniref:Phosphate transport regulator n=1 Tax=Megasphaera cerevisiae DSM 20462 TaxID=1122219 RepID=A0A0J6WT89_9FIRM|nr:DUF47 family protein [Megasphaera cerevisiae]KMO86740.1 phosphate transport regulator [Megasphaera cerevisiae DSM 20462]SJZ93319.1 hypothetical protein SAMN05660900_01861 [Megasphaera cerevisiae DSM 20462]